MNYRLFGRTSQKVSEIGIGTWQIGGMWGPRDDRAALDALAHALDLGITFIDTAYVYGDGHSEQLIGNVVAKRKCRNQVLIATKVPPKNRQWPADPESLAADVFPANWVREMTEASLKNLRTDYLDLQQLHVWASRWLNEGDWLAEIAKLKQEGKIRHFGVSINDHQPDTALELVQSGLIDSVQVIYNIFDQTPAEQLFPLCQKHKVAVIVRVPFDEGSLTGALTPTTTFHPKDWRSRYFTPARLPEVCVRVEKLKAFLTDETPTLAALALKFCLAHPAVSTVIPGMRAIRNINTNVAVSESSPLSPHTLAQLASHAWSRNFYP